MGRINGWKRVQHRNLDDDRVTDEIERRGRAVIAAWRHTDLQTKLEYVYEPDAEQPFEVRLKDDEVSLEEAGRYPTRTAGGNANKDLMRRYP